MLSREELMLFLDYNPVTGIFIWKISPAQRAKIGTEAGHVGGSGYREIELRGKVYQSHRIAFLFVTGKWPKGEIDHIDGEKCNNKWTNLRDSTKSQNQHNRKKQSKCSTSSYKGVSFHKKTGKWQSYINLNNKRKYLGLFDNEILAHEAYAFASKALHGEFSRLY